MSTIQKIVKAMAIALAVFIIFSIVSGIISIIFSIAGVNWLVGKVTPEAVKDVETSFDIEEVKNLKLESGIENVEIIASNEFKVIGQNVPEAFECKIENGTLIIDSNSKKVNIRINNEAIIKVYVPEEFVFANASLMLGVGMTNIEELRTETLELKCGAGKVDLYNVEAKENSTIACGVGEFNIENSKLSNLNFTAGIGECSVDAELVGECSIETGIGETNVKLVNFEENLGKISTEKGIGQLNVNGKECSNKQVFGSGEENRIYVKGGIGEINIEY